MSYIDEELKIGTEEDDDTDVEEDLNDPLSNIPEEDLLDDEFAGLIDTEY